MSAGGPSLRRNALVPLSAAGERLDLFLVAEFPGISRKIIKKTLDSGQVFVDGRVERRAGFPLVGGECVQVTVSGAFGTDRAPALSIPPLQILYRDDDLLAIDKPAGWPVHRTVAGRVNLHDLVRAELAPQAILLHRLDADTSGVLLFALSGPANLALSRQFAQHEVVKVYLALVAGTPPDAFTVSDHLRSGVRGRTVRVTSGGKSAETFFRTLATGEGVALVAAWPKTGRTHQIRAHLSIEGYPLLGDRLYGGPTSVTLAGCRRVADRHLLHAVQLRVAHPVSAEPLSFNSPLPADFRAFLPPDIFPGDHPLDVSVHAPIRP